MNFLKKLLCIYSILGCPLNATASTVCEDIDTAKYELVKEKTIRYYKKLLKNENYDDLSVRIDGFNKYNIRNENLEYFRIEVVYSIIENNKNQFTRFESWYWDVDKNKCYRHTDIRTAQKPGEHYQGLLCSVGYIDYTSDSFAKIILKVLKNRIRGHMLQSSKSKKRYTNE